MSTKPETVTYTVTREIKDAGGVPIREGSVLINLKDGGRGVVTQIVRLGDRVHLLGQVGDVMIQTSPGCSRGTNQYDRWQHIPHNEQTYNERYLSWLKRGKYEHDEDREASYDEGLAIDGIMALLPDDTVDWDHGPWPDRIEDALRFLVNKLNEVSTNPTKEKS